MPKISLCMIARDEQDYIDITIENLKDIVSEIIVVDTGSRDNTRERAKKYGVTVCNYIWCDDFSKVRNYSFSVANEEFILWMDAGEYFDEVNIRKLKELILSLDESIDAIYMKKVIEEGSNREDIRYVISPRIIRKESNIRWKGKAIEVLDVENKKVKGIDIKIKVSQKKLGSERFQIIKENLSNNLDISVKEKIYYAKLLMKNYRDREAVIMYREIMRSENEEDYYYLETSLNLAEYYLRRKDIGGFKEYLFKSYEYGKPVAKAYFLLGEYFYNKCQYEKAIHWYSEAKNLDINFSYDSEIDTSYKNIFIFGQLSLCYSKIGDFNMAKFYNDKLATYSENSPIIKYNRRSIEKTTYYIGENI